MHCFRYVIHTRVWMAGLELFGDEEMSGNALIIHGTRNTCMQQPLATN